MVFGRNIRQAPTFRTSPLIPSQPSCQNSGDGGKKSYPSSRTEASKCCLCKVSSGFLPSLLHRLFVVVPLLLRVRPIQLGRGEDEDDFCSFRADSPSVTSVSGEDEQDRVPEQEFPPFFFPRSTAVVLKGKTKGRTESLPPLCSHFPPPQK